MARPYNTPTGLGSKGRVTSREAAECAATHADGLRERIFAEIFARGERGATPEEIRALLGLPITTVRPRCSDLSNAERIVAQRDPRDLRRNERRRSECGGKSTVLVAPEFQRKRKD